MSARTSKRREAATAPDSAATTLIETSDVAVVATRAQSAQKIEELGRMISAYSEVTDRLQQSHDQLQRTVQALRVELLEKDRLLERKNRLAALGEMAAGIAHEIRNPLGGIQLYASMLARDVDDRPASLDLVKKIAAGVRRMDGLVGQVLQFTREIRANRVDADMAAVIGQAIEMAGDRLARANIACRIEGPSSLISRIDPLLLGQAVLNLVLNAAEAIEQSGQTSGTVAISYGGAESRQRTHLFIRVRDDGPGVPAELIEKIFDPFFTTKDTGTGLGLAIVHRIVEAHDGTITYEPAPARGAVFELRI
jgi:signal transduction histidine kinase